MKMEKRQKFSIRKFSIGVASVIVGQFYLGVMATAPKVKADERLTTEVSVLATSEERHLSNVSLPSEAEEKHKDSIQEPTESKVISEVESNSASPVLEEAEKPEISISDEKSDEKIKEKPLSVVPSKSDEQKESSETATKDVEEVTLPRIRKARSVTSENRQDRQVYDYANPEFSRQMMLLGQVGTYQDPEHGSRNHNYEVYKYGFFPVGEAFKDENFNSKRPILREDMGGSVNAEFDSLTSKDPIDFSKDFTIRYRATVIPGKTDAAGSYRHIEDGLNANGFGISFLPLDLDQLAADFTSKYKVPKFTEEHIIPHDSMWSRRLPGLALAKESIGLRVDLSRNPSLLNKEPDFYQVEPKNVETESPNEFAPYATFFRTVVLDKDSKKIAGFGIGSVPSKTPDVYFFKKTDPKAFIQDIEQTFITTLEYKAATKQLTATVRRYILDRAGYHGEEPNLQLSNPEVRTFSMDISDFVEKHKNEKIHMVLSSTGGARLRQHSNADGVRQVRQHTSEKYQKSLHTPKGIDLTTKWGVMPDSASAITNKDELPIDTSYSWQTPPNVQVSGQQDAVIRVTYPNNETEDVNIKVTVTAPDKDKYQPTTAPVTTNINTQPNPADAVTNKGSLPPGTTYGWKAPVPTDTVGDKPAAVVVTYPDKTVDEVPATVKVVDNRPDKDKYQPTTQTQTVNLNAQPNPADAVTNKGSLPPGTTYGWKAPVPTDTVGDKQGTVVVTYPDKTVDEVPATVKVVDNRPDKDKYQPTTQTQTVNLNAQPNPADAVTNKGSLPNGTTYGWKAPVPTDTVGDKPAAVVVTYPDKTVDEVPATVKVVDNRPDKDKYQPTTAPVTTNINTQPNPADAVTNKGSLPPGTTYGWKTPVPTDTVGDKPATVVVTYPDKTVDEVPATVKVVDNRPDKDKYQPTTQTQTVNLNAQPNPADAVTNKGSLPPGTTYGWKAPVPTDTVGDKQGTVVVTYPDKTVDEVPATVKVVDNRPDKDKYQPTTQTQTVNLNAQPNPADAVTNKGSLPPGTTYGWKAPVPTDTVGDKQGTVVVTYPDKTVDEVPATVKVVDNRPDKDKYQPTTQTQTVNLNAQPNPADAVTNKGSLPPGTTYGWKAPVPTDTVGDKPATVVVTYPDKTVDEVPATVKVVDNRPDKDKYQPTTAPVTTNINTQPNPADAVTNKGSLPNGTTYGWKAPVPTDTVGDKPATVVVTYPDKTVDEVPATVKVVDNRPDKDKYQPTTAPVTTNINTQPNPADAVTNKGSLPPGTTYGWKAPVPTDTVGDKQGTVVVTYPDKTVDEVPATVKVVDNRPDKDKYQPTTQTQTVNLNAQPNPADAVTNKGSLPNGTTYGWKAPVPTDTVGDKPAAVVVTYPDKTVDEVPATVKVVDNRPDKDKYQPTTAPVTTNINTQPNPADAVTNKGSLPPGTTYGWKTPVPTDTVGDKPATVVVTYPDKTVDEVPATVKVVDNRPDKDKYQPTTQTQTVNLNAQPNPADAVTNKGSLPPGTTYGWKAPVPTDTVGDKQGTVVVTYPDKTVDEVPATVKVVDNRPDKDKYQPTTQTQTVNLNAQPNPADAVTNKGSLPPGTTYGWKAPVPTDTVGDKQGTVVVTYPDKTVDEVPATVKVVDNRPDKDKYQPTTQTQTVNLNAQPNPADAVTNKGSLPPGTTYGWKAPVPTDTVGDKPATVVVTYPDKTVDEVPATVKVVDNRPDKDKYQPTTAPVTTNINTQPNPADAVTNKGSLPNGTTYGWKAPVPTDTVGDKPATVVVTYPDKTVDEVPATVKVVDNRPDKDKYQPTTAPVTTNINTQPNPADAVTNKGSLPPGTTYGWKAPVPTDTVGDKQGTVVVTYPDKTVDEVPATVKVVDNRPDKDKYQPTTQTQTVNLNAQPNPADAVTNKGSLPPGTTYDWKAPVPTDTAGDKPATVVVTYPDKTVDEVPATVKVVDNRPDKDKYQPTTAPVTTNINTQPNPADAVTNKGSLPPGTTYGWKAPVPTDTVGDKQGTVVVTYPDKTVDEVPATVKVVDNRPDKDKYQPTTAPVTTNINTQPNPADAVTNKGSLPPGTTYGWKAPVPTDTVGDKQGTVVVTYPDKTVDEVPATVKVVDNRPDKDKYQPTTAPVTTNINTQPNPADAVTNKGSLPPGTTYGWKTPVPTDTVGDKPATVVVTYPDKTVDEVPATVKVVDNRPDKDKYQPTTQTQTVNLNAQPNPADAVTNKGSLPNGTTYGWKAPVPTDTVGDKPAAVVVTYPDKTVDEVPATVKVVDNRPDKDKYQPTTQTQTVNLNAQPNPADAVTNKGSLPPGTTYGWKAPVPTDTAGDKPATVVVTYPDKTVDEVPATVKVVDNRPDKDKYQPTTAPVTTNINTQPNPADAVTNKGSLPPGTTYGWKAPVPTDTVGDKQGTVVVTYPDKTVDEVPATVKVVDNRPDKDKYQPTTQTQTVNLNAQPNPADAVTNKGSLPPGTTYGWKAPVPTDTVGDKQGTVVVTYPDKTVDEVPATVKVVDNRPDKDKYQPTTQTQTVNLNAQPNPADAVTNKGSLPPGTTYGWKAPVPTDTVGDKPATVVVTYPDKTVDEVPATVKVVDNRPDKDKYQPTTAPVTTNINTQPNPADAVTNKGSLPNGTTYGWKAPVPTDTVGDKPATVVVTYPDKTVDEVPATVKVVDNRPDKDKYQPTTAPVTTNINTQPNPADAVTNKGSLPPGTTYGWKAPVPTDTVGDKQGTVVVTYPDKTVDEVPATVKVVDNRPDKDKYQPTTQTQTVNLNAQPNPADAVTNKGSLPPGTTYGWKAPVPTDTAGDKPATVVVTYPDKTVDEVPATVKVVDNRPDKDKYQPTTAPVTTNINTQPNPADAVTNKGSLPPGTTYGWKAPVPTDTVGDKQGTVVVTYPDKTVDEVPATVKVVDNRPDKDKYQPTTAPVTTNINTQPNPADAVTNKGSLPPGTTYGWKAPVPTDTVGDKQGTVVVTYPDKTVDEVPATVKVVDNRPDKDKYQPTTAPVTTNINTQPNPADAVTNKGSLPPGTTYGWKTPVPTDTVGDKPATVVVTYPDKTVDEVPATVKVVDNRPDKDKYQPTTQTQTVNLNAQPNPADAVTNKGSLPNGTTYGWKAPVPTDTVGDKPAAVVVTYPDKTVDEVPATVKVVDNRPDKDKYQPTTQTQTVNLNAQPNPADAVTNKGSLPPGTTYGWKAPVPTDTVGDKQGTVVVTYPDKTVDEVPATVKVVDNRPDKDKYQPTTQTQTVNLNAQPNPADAVTNKGSLPPGTTYGWKAPVPTDTAGDKPATVVVTYPDKTVDEVPATVKVVDNRPDKDKYQPTTQTQTVNLNAQPNPADAVTNKGSLPPGTTYGWKAPVPTDTAGDKPATVVVTYPDKTVDEVPATVKVVDNRPDKDKYQPTTQTQTVNLNAQPNPADAVTNKGSLPPGTTYGWKTPVPTDTVGDKPATVVVTYPDKTVDEVPATVKVVDNRGDKGDTGTNGNQTGDTNGNQTGDTNGNQTGGTNGNQTGGTNGNQTGGTNGNQTGGTNGNQTGGTNGNQTGGTNGNQTGGTNGNQTGDTNGNQTGDTNGNQTGGTNGNQTDGTNGNQTGGTNGNQTGGTNGNQTGGTNGNQTGGTNGNQTGGTNGNQTGGTNGNQTGGTNGNQTGGTNGNQTGGTNGNQTGGTNGNQTGGTNGNQTGGTNGNQTGDTNGNQTGGTNGNQTGGTNGNQTGGTNGNQTGGTNGNQTGGTNGNQTGGTNGNQTGGTNGNQTGGTNGNQTGGTNGNQTGGTNGNQTGGTNGNQTGGTNGNQTGGTNGNQTGGTNGNQTGGTNGNQTGGTNGNQTGGTNGNQTGGTNGNQTGGTNGNQTGGTNGNQTGGTNGNQTGGTNGNQTGGTEPIQPVPVLTAVNSGELPLNKGNAFDKKATLPNTGSKPTSLLPAAIWTILGTAGLLYAAKQRKDEKDFEAEIMNLK